MSQQPKPIYPSPPYRYPYGYPPMMSDKMKILPPISGTNPTPNLPTSPNIPLGAPGQFIPQRLLNPYYSGFGMFPMHQIPPYPYMPVMRPSQIPPGQNQNSKNNKQSEQRPITGKPYYNRLPPAFYNHPGMFYQPPPFPVSDQQKPKTQNKDPIPIQIDDRSKEKVNSKEIKPPTSVSTHPPIQRQQLKPKIKQPKHADVKQYSPELPKKKKKKELAVLENLSLRQTRQKKQSIERIMSMVMRQRPPRDRVIKIGRQFQATIPESFINQYEYNLKIKLQKKRNLMSRIVKCNSS